MRKILFSLLLATAAVTPAVARPADNDERAQAIEARAAAKQEARTERQESRGQTPAIPVQGARPDFRPDRPNFMPQGNFQPGARPDGERQQWNRPPQMSQPADHRFDGRGPDQRQWNRPAPDMQQARSGFDRQQNTNTVTNWRSHERDVTRSERYSEGGRQGYTRVAPSYARPDRPAPVPQTAYQYGGHSPQWNTNWHNDRRYDWRNYRDHHRSIFRIGIYYDPFGWGYQRYNIGWRLWPAYYGQNYWLTDPYMYDLPPAPWPLQWVRYYDDALLVNVYTGQVVDVMYDFFW